MSEYIGKSVTETEVILTYLVPVYVVVRNGDDGEGPYIDKVVVDDEVDFSEENRQSALDCDGAVIPNDDPAVLGAIKAVQDGEAGWPAWEFGW